MSTAMERLEHNGLLMNENSRISELIQIRGSSFGRLSADSLAVCLVSINRDVAGGGYWLQGIV